MRFWNSKSALTEQIVAVVSGGPYTSTMTVTLSPKHEAFIQSEIDSGRYKDANEVLMAAMDGLDKADRMLEMLLAEESSLNPNFRTD